MIELLPFPGASLRSRLLKLAVESQPARVPGVVLLFQLRRLRQRMHFRFDSLQRAALQRPHVAERLAFVEPDSDARTGELPVHGKGIGRPISLDDAGKRRDRIFRPVHWALHQKIDARLGTKSYRDMEGQNAVAEVAHRRHAGPWIAENAHRTDVRAAFPASNEAAAAKNFPAVGISDGKRQAAIGKTISRRVHPAALDRSRTDVQFVSFQNIGSEFHAIHIWQNIPEVSDRSCLSERLPYTVTRRTCEVCSRQGSPILCPRAACLSVPV